jgi:hypothetical protein
MFYKNKLTEFLFQCGYNGYQDIDQYWYKHKDRILELFKSNVSKDEFDRVLKSFEYQIIWRSAFGIFLRFEISKYLENTKDNTANLNEVRTRRGDEKYSVSDFLVDHKRQESDVLNLKGISIVNRTVKNITIENTTFDYGSLVAMNFIDVTFKNCSFKDVSFRGSVLYDVVFENCLLENNDFSNCLIKVHADSSIKDPLINTNQFYFKTKNRIRRALFYRESTIFLNDNLITMSRSEKVEEWYEIQKVYVDKMIRHGMIHEFLEQIE